MNNPAPTDEFTSRFIAYRPTLTGLIRKVIREAPIEAEDVLQDVWILGKRGYPSLRDPAHFRSWIGRTAINTALMALRKSRKTSEHADIDKRPDLPCLDPAPDEMAFRKEVRRAAEKLKIRMPMQFTALYLVRIEGLTYREAAEALDLAEGTVKSDVFRATERLRITLTGLKAA